MSTPAIAPANGPAKVIEKKLFIAVDPVNNNNKFWQYERLDRVVSEMSKGKMLSGDIRFTWGRVGAEKPESKVEMFDEKKLRSKIREKQNKSDGPSYNEITVVGGSQGVSTVAPKALAKTEVARVAVAEIAGKCPVTASLVKKLAEANKHELLAASGGELDVDLETGIIRTALGVVELTAVKDARAKLDLMAPYVKMGRTEDRHYTDLLGNYLRLIPQATPRKRGWHADFIKLDAQTSLLDQLETSIELANQRVTDAVAAGPKDIKQPTTFNVSLKLVDDRGVISKIESLYYNNKGRHDCSHLKPVRVYEVTIPTMLDAFNADGRKVGNVKRLWHGTRIFNVLSILKRGFVLPSQLSTVQTTGAMYGPGLYFSAMSTKSLNYSYGYWDGGRRDNNCYMFSVDVAMGKEYIPSGSGNGKRPGYDSCWAKPGTSGVINDEQIVYRTSQANIRYLVEFN